MVDGFKNLFRDWNKTIEKKYASINSCNISIFAELIHKQMLNNNFVSYIRMIWYSAIWIQSLYYMLHNIQTKLYRNFIQYFAKKSPTKHPKTSNQIWWKRKIVEHITYCAQKKRTIKHLIIGHCHAMDLQTIRIESVNEASHSQLIALVV